jgi:adenylate kinase family enzyme
LYPLVVQRVAVVGAGGAGKSTFANALVESTGLPVIHLDRWYWRAGWVKPATAEWEALQVDLLAGDRWIADGNYGGSLDLRLSRADTVIILAPPRLVCVAGGLTRVLRNRGRAVQAPGCPERLSSSAPARKSL